MGGQLLQNITISGSYRKFSEEIGQALEAFRDLGVNVLSPRSATILSSIDGFVSLKGDLVQRINDLSEGNIANAIKLIENSHLQAIQQSDALWIVIPQGYCGIATAFEIGWALAHNVPVFYDARYLNEVKEPMIRAYANPTNGIDDLVYNFDSMPQVDPVVSRYFMRSILLSKTAQSNSGFNANVAVGPVIVDYSGKRYKSGQKRDILLVRTHKWNGRFSIVGGRLKKGEGLTSAFSRVVTEQTSLAGLLGADVCVFDEISDSGFYERGTSRIFVDKTVRVRHRRIRLDERAQEYLWIPPDAALEIDLEPNARRTIEIYNQSLN